MRQAIEEARSGVLNGDGGPFGAVVVKNGRILAKEHNTVLRDNDPTCHAELKAISKASGKLSSYDLSGCELYTTTEPCPMCFAAIHWARVRKLIFGTRIDDVARLGFNELILPAEHMKRKGGSDIIIEADYMRRECVDLLKFWESLPERKVY